MNRYYRELIGNTIGRVLDVDVDVDIDDTGWGSFLRVRVDINLTKPLARIRKITIKGDTLWLSVKYAKLPKFCYGCDRILHTKGICQMSKSSPKDQFGNWLRGEVTHKTWSKSGEEILTINGQNSPHRQLQRWSLNIFMERNPSMRLPQIWQNNRVDPHYTEYKSNPSMF